MSAQPSLLAKAEPAQVILPSNEAEVQVVRDRSVFGLGKYWAYFKDGTREIIGGPGSGFGNVSTLGGTIDRVAKFTGPNSIGDSQRTDDGTDVDDTVVGDYSIQTGDDSFENVGDRKFTSVGGNNSESTAGLKRESANEKILQTTNDYTENIGTSTIVGNKNSNIGFDENVAIGHSRSVTINNDDSLLVFGTKTVTVIGDYTENASTKNNNYLNLVEVITNDSTTTIATSETKTVGGPSTENIAGRKTFNTGLFNNPNIPEHADNAAALAALLIPGDFYKTTAALPVAGVISAGDAILKIVQ